MRQRTDNRFPFPVDVFASPFVQTLPQTDQLALVKLWTWAWANDCRVPIDDARAMGIIAGLGDAWAASKLRASQGDFFSPDGAAIALQAAWDHRRVWREKSAEGGRRSGIARRVKSKGGTPPLKGGSAGSNHPLTTVPRTPEVETGSPLPEIVPPPTILDGDFPPIPPLRETSLEPILSQGGGGERVFRLEPQPTRAEIDSRVDIVLDAYMLLVKPAEPVNNRARSNVRRLLTKGTDVQTLVDASRNYGATMDKLMREPQYRKAPHNFFSTREAVWKQHLKPLELGGVSSLACFAEKLRPLCPNAAEWFVDWADRHAARNNFTKADDPHRVAQWWATFASLNVTADEAEHASVWMTTRPTVASRTAQRDALVERIRASRKTAMLPPPPVKAIEGPGGKYPWDSPEYQATRRKSFPDEYNADGTLNEKGRQQRQKQLQQQQDAGLVR